MIVPKGRQLWNMLWYVGKPLALLVAYDVAVVVAYKILHWEWVALPHIPVALLGSAIGVILGFRNQSSYARWWEARTLWGAIVNNSRSWGRQVMTALLPVGEQDSADVATMQRRMVYLQIAYVHALRQHLRGLEPWKELAPLMTAAELDALRGQKNVPLAIQREMGWMLRECQTRGWIDIAQWRAMDLSLDDLIDAQGGAERIKNTPMPKQYDYFPQIFVRMFCLLLPLTMVINLEWFTPLGSTLAGFVFLALDKIGRDLEDPFENTIYDVPLTSITTTIEVNLRQLLGETTLPPAVTPVNGVLW
jgi:ion channel-forming bestrophin family protein